mmetsp:Transcript_12296/g.18450  ORF Transcript_12296/g.18450 Transcript_12296/m.18450 type:complete len:457 (+) Transcript_12296:282-1652(+)
MENSFEYVPKEDRMKSYYYNNRFRFGSGIDDRFISIVFNKDPWVDENATIVFIGEADSTTLGGKSESAICNFSYPLKAYSRYERGIVNFCSIPHELYSSLTRKHREIIFSLEAIDGTLLKNVRVKRLHALDRRFFNVSCSMMTYTLDDHVVYEFIMYYLMMGVEHFYIYDNRRIYPSINGNNSHPASYWKLTNSILRPFLDANLVTLIYFPYLPSRVSGAMDSVQEVCFASVMQQFGHYNKFIGLFDYDEFYLPSENFHNRLTVPHVSSSTTFISSVLQTLTSNPKSQRYPWSKNDPIDSVNFNSVDMGCSDNDAIQEFVNVRKRMGNITQAAVTHCNREGVLFRQFAIVNGSYTTIGSGALPYPPQYIGRGKCFFVPEFNPAPTTPHFTVHAMLGTEEYGGIICHYTNFRLTVLATGTDNSSEWQTVYKKKLSNNCHDFTLKMLREFVQLHLVIK